MTTSFSSLPIIDLKLLSTPSPPPLRPPLPGQRPPQCLRNHWLRLPHQRAPQLLPPGRQQDNLKEGLELGPKEPLPQHPSTRPQKFNLAEPTIWPSTPAFQPSRTRLETLYAELQALSSTLLSLLAISLDKPADHFAPYLTDSLSTLRLLHYPPQPNPPLKLHQHLTPLCCTPHTDSGILTLLHQDPTGGLEVLNASGHWIPAPYVPGSLVVNIGDLLARVSGGKFVATQHRVRTNEGGESGDGMGRFSVPFFFEPGEACVVRSVDGGEGVVYGEYVRAKMGTWVEYQDDDDEPKLDEAVGGRAVEAY
ncbi:hypothetical protein Q7P37_007901 [Cladosporium fusiforme]